MKHYSRKIFPSFPISPIFIFILPVFCFHAMHTGNLMEDVVKCRTAYNAYFSNFLRIIHVYNPGIAFSMGTGLSEGIRAILFSLIPLAVIIVVLVVYFRSDDFTPFQRWTIMGIIGGGLGNLFDRFFRSEGVVDFIDVKFYGLFGLERWPTFNIADAAVLICGIALIISFIVLTIRERKATKDTQ